MSFFKSKKPMRASAAAQERKTEHDVRLEDRQRMQAVSVPSYSHITTVTSVPTPTGAIYINPHPQVFTVPEPAQVFTVPEPVDVDAISLRGTWLLNNPLLWRRARNTCTLLREAMLGEPSFRLADVDALLARGPRTTSGGVVHEINVPLKPGTYELGEDRVTVLREGEYEITVADNQPIPVREPILAMLHDHQCLRVRLDKGVWSDSVYLYDLCAENGDRCGLHVKYDSADELPEWMQDKLRRLWLMPIPPPMEYIAGIGARMDKDVYWVDCAEHMS